jgi:transposase
MVIFFSIIVASILLGEDFMNATITTTLSFFNMQNIKPNFSALAREHNMDRHTLKKHYDAGGYKPRKKRSYTSKLDEHLELIKSKLEIIGVTYIGIYHFLVNEKGYSGSYSNFKAYLRSRNLTKPKYKNTPHVKYETPKGKQLQFDWKEDLSIMTKYGEIINFNLFASILSSSRLHYFVYSESKTEEATIRCLLDTFYHIGGIPKEALTDNMSSIVDVRGKKKVKHPKILQLEKDLGIQIKLCKARSPQTKGKVESANRFVSRILAYNNEIEDKDHLLRIIDNLNKTINNEVNKTTNVAPIVLFQKEKEYLSPIPTKCMIDSYIVDNLTCVVPPTLLVKFKGNEYSVPMKYINKRVKLIAIDNILHIYFNTELVRTHNISDKKINYNREDYQEGLRHAIQNKDLDINKIAEENLKLFDFGGRNE